MKEVQVKRFLLADDDRDDREMFSEALAALDPEIICNGVEDGKQALNLLSTSKPAYPNIIFLDINMPVMNGWELLRKLKSDNQFANIPVVVYSTSSRPMDRQTAEALGAMCFVTKPDSFTMVKEMLEIVIESISHNAVTDMCKQIHTALRQQ